MSSSNQTFVNSGYTELKAQTTNAYFGATLRVIYMFFMSGNFYDALNQNTLNVESPVKKSFNLHPNPVKDILHINFESLELRNIKLYAFTGKTIFEKEVSQLDYDLNMSNLQAGVYFLKIGSKSFKIIKS